MWRRVHLVSCRVGRRFQPSNLARGWPTRLEAVSPHRTVIPPTFQPLQPVACELLMYVFQERETVRIGSVAGMVGEVGGVGFSAVKRAEKPLQPPWNRLEATRWQVGLVGCRCILAHAGAFL